MDANEEKLQALIETTDFEHLNDEDRKWVLSTFSETEYRQRRKIILSSEALFEEEAPFLVPEASTKFELRQRLKNRYRKATPAAIFAMLFQTRIPAYQAAIAVLAIIFIWPWFLGEKEVIIPGEERTRIVYQPKIDTVFLPGETVAAAPIERVVTRVQYIEKAPEVKWTNTAIEERETLLAENNIYQISDSAQQQLLERSLGNSAYDKNELQGLMVVVD